MTHLDDVLPRRPSTLQIAIWAVLLIIVMVLSLRDLHATQVGYAIDDAIYVVLAQSLVRTDQYGFDQVLGDQSADPAYPFGYPLLLAPLVWMFPVNSDPLKALSLLATLLNVSLLFWGWPWLSKRSYWWGIGVVALYSLSVWTIQYAQLIMSEAVFLTLCLGVILLAERAVRGKNRLWWIPLMTVVSAFVAFTRTLGCVVVGTVFGYLLIARRKALWKELVAVALGMIILVGLLLALTPIRVSGLLPLRYLQSRDAALLLAVGSAVTFTDLEEHLPPDELTEDGPLPGRDRLGSSGMSGLFFRRTMDHLGRDLRQAVLPLGLGPTLDELGSAVGIPSLPVLVGLPILALLVLGFYRWYQEEGLTVFNFVPIPYLGALLLWNWKGPRLLYPILPQLFIGVFWGIDFILHRLSASTNRILRRKWTRRVLVVVGLLLVSLSIYQVFLKGDMVRQRPDLRMRTAWIVANTTPDDVIMSEAPIGDYYYSQRRYVPQPSSLSLVHEIDEYLTAHGVDYVLIAPRIGSWRAPVYSDDTASLLALLAELTSVHLIYASQDGLTRVYWIQP